MKSVARLEPKPRRVVRIVAGLTLLLVLGMSAPLAWHALQTGRTERVVPTPAERDEAAEILTVLLNGLRHEGVPLPPPQPGEQREDTAPQTLLLDDRSLAFCHSAQPGTGECSTGEDAETVLGEAHDYNGIALRWRRELVAANAQPRALPRLEARRVRLAPSAVIAGAFSDDDGWQSFYRTFPDSAGPATISWPVLTPDRQQALVYLTHRCDSTCGSGRMFVLERGSDGWTVVLTAYIWMS